MAFSARPPWRSATGLVTSACEGLPVRAHHGVGSTRRPSPRGLRISSGDSSQLARSISGLPAGLPCGMRPAPDPDSSLGVVQRSPLHRHGFLASTPGLALPLRCPEELHAATPLVLHRDPEGSGARQGPGARHRPGVATLRTRSVLAVLPDFDGLLRLEPCRSVAPCCRSWGSPRFSSARSRVFSAPCGALYCPATRPAHGGAVERHRHVLEVEDSLAGIRRSPGRAQAARTRVDPRDAVPFEAFPLQAAVPRHRGRCPPAVGHGPTSRPSCFHEGRETRSRLVASPRPQGFHPLASPLRRIGVSPTSSLDAPLGFIPCEGLPAAVFPWPTPCALKRARPASSGPAARFPTSRSQRDDRAAGGASGLAERDAAQPDCLPVGLDGASPRTRPGVSFRLEEP